MLILQKQSHSVKALISSLMLIREQYSAEFIIRSMWDFFKSTKNITSKKSSVRIRYLFGSRKYRLRLVANQARRRQTLEMEQTVLVPKNKPCGLNPTGFVLSTVNLIYFDIIYLSPVAILFLHLKPELTNMEQSQRTRSTYFGNSRLLLSGLSITLTKNLKIVWSRWKINLILTR